MWLSRWEGLHQGHCPTPPEAERTRDGVDIFCICKHLLLFHLRNMWQQGNAQLTLLHLFVLFGLGSYLFLRKGRRRKIQDLTRMQCSQVLYSISHHQSMS